MRDPAARPPDHELTLATLLAEWCYAHAPGRIVDALAAQAAGWALPEIRAELAAELTALRARRAELLGRPTAGAELAAVTAELVECRETWAIHGVGCPSCATGFADGPELDCGDPDGCGFLKDPRDPPYPSREHLPERTDVAPVMLHVQARSARARRLLDGADRAVVTAMRRAPVRGGVYYFVSGWSTVPGPADVVPRWAVAALVDDWQRMYGEHGWRFEVAPECRGARSSGVRTRERRGRDMGCRASGAG